jgi:hypothetical protein
MGDSGDAAAASRPSRAFGAAALDEALRRADRNVCGV